VGKVGVWSLVSEEEGGAVLSIQEKSVDRKTVGKVDCIAINIESRIEVQLARAANEEQVEEEGERCAAVGISLVKAHVLATVSGHQIEAVVHNFDILAEELVGNLAVSIN